MSAFIVVCFIVTIASYTKLSSNSESVSSTTVSNKAISTTTNPNNTSATDAVPSKSTDVKKLINVNIYSKCDPKHVITLNPQYDNALISRYGKLLEQQSPAKGEDGSDYEVIVSYSDGSQFFYGIDKKQSELVALCDSTLGLAFANPM